MLESIKQLAALQTPIFRQLFMDFEVCIPKITPAAKASPAPAAPFIRSSVISTEPWTAVSPADETATAP